MNKFLSSVAIIMLTLLSSACGVRHNLAPLPPELRSVDPVVAEHSNVVMLGSFETGRTPCVFHPDGSHEWYLTTGFNVERVLRGEVKASYVEVHIRAFVDEPRLDLAQGEKFFVLLKADNRRSEQLRSEERLGFWEALGDEDVLAIVTESGYVVYSGSKNSGVAPKEKPSPESSNIFPVS